VRITLSEICDKGPVFGKCDANRLYSLCPVFEKFIKIGFLTSYKIKKSRTGKFIEFNFSPVQKDQRASVVSSELLRLGVSRDAVRGLVRRSEPDYIMEKIDQYEWVLSNYPEKANSAGWLVNSITNDWIDNNYKEHLNRKEDLLKKEKARYEEALRQADSLKSERIHSEVFNKYWAGLSEEQKKEFDLLLKDTGHIPYFMKNYSSPAMSELFDITMDQLRISKYLDLEKENKLPFLN
jgi:hypothetical protein